MSSSNALKYKITIKRSYFAGAVNLLLYSIVILSLLFVVPFTLSSSIIYLLLVLIALIAAQKAYHQSDQFMLSESSLVERVIDDKTYYGSINSGSFYNGFFIFLILDMGENVLMDKSNKQFITLYCDAVTQSEYRLLARLINNGRN